MKPMHSDQRLAVLLVLDGWGLAVRREGNAIAQANIPTMTKLFSEGPHAVLSASGESVGLPHGLMGNSEVGHLHLGAGRVVPQDLVRINEAITNGTFFHNPVFISAIHHARSNGTRLHVMGLLSHGGVHSEAAHLYALLQLIQQQGFDKDVYLHIFTDGRDTAPQSAKGLMNELVRYTTDLGVGKIATIAGRHYAMDRAHNWERVQKVYEAVVEGKGLQAHDAEHVIDAAYKEGQTDQTILPTVLVDENGKPVATMEDRDVVIFFNLRSDRARQLTKPFVLTEFPFFERKKVLHDLYFVGMTNFGDDLPMSIAFPADYVKNALPETLARAHNVEQYYVAEEEKYAQVAYFFHGGSSIPYANEKKCMVDSLGIASYIDQPEMSTKSVADAVIQEVEHAEKNFFALANFANADVLAHTGDFAATVKGIEAVDAQVARVLAAVQKRGGSLVVTADHGHAEEMLDAETGNPRTAHTSHPVPCAIVTDRRLPKRLPEGGLANVAPTILDLLGIEKPAEMTEESLLPPASSVA